MRLTGHLAEPILIKLSKFLDYNINVMDEKGVIVSSSDPSRIGQFHEGAKHVISNKKPLLISSNNLDKYAGAKPGVNLPIEFMGEIVGAVGVTGDPEELYKFANIMKITVEAMIQQVYVNNQLQHKNKLIENWIYDLINPHTFNAKIVERNGRHILNIDFSKKRTIFLLHFPDLASNSWKSLDAMMLLNEKKDGIIKGIDREVQATSFCSFIDNVTCLVAIECKNEEVQEEKDIARKLQDYYKQQNLTTWIGIGNRYIGVEGYRDSFFQAKQSLELMSIFNSDETIVHILDWKLIRLFASIPEKIRNEALEHYFSDSKKLNSELMYTLEVLFDNQLRMNEASEALNIHRNTLQYRLERISQQVGLDPRNFHDAVTLMTLLIFNKMKE